MILFNLLNLLPYEAGKLLLLGGGTPLVGICKPVIKAHGSSDAFAIKNAIRQAAGFAASGLIEDIAENIEHMRLPAGDRSGAAAD